MRWKNGGGTTTEILVEPPGAARFAWRVSVADVGASGPFSSFPGYERHIVVIEGEGMTLACGEHGRIDLEPFSPRTFSGDWSVDGRLVAGPVRDFNLIVDRAWGTGSLEVAWIDAPLALLPGGTLLVHVLSGDLADLPAHPGRGAPSREIRRGPLRSTCARVTGATWRAASARASATGRARAPRRTRPWPMR